MRLFIKENTLSNGADVP
ncbi:hypothetical protein AVEN_216691-1, partial [Araneus ventricosus]